MKQPGICERCGDTGQIKRRRRRVKSTRSKVFLYIGFLIENQIPDTILIGGVDACPDCAKTAEEQFAVIEERKKIKRFQDYQRNFMLKLSAQCG